MGLYTKRFFSPTAEVIQPYVGQLADVVLKDNVTCHGIIQAVSPLKLSMGTTYYRTQKFSQAEHLLDIRWEDILMLILTEKTPLLNYNRG